MHTTAKHNRLYTVRLNHISMAKQLGYIEDYYNNYGRHSKISIHRIIGKQRRVYKLANLYGAILHYGRVYRLHIAGYAKKDIAILNKL